MMVSKSTALFMLLPMRFPDLPLFSKQKEGGGVNGCSLDVAMILTVWEKSAEVQSLECESSSIFGKLGTALMDMLLTLLRFQSV